MTSRSLLRIAGEHALPVPPLDVPDLVTGASLDEAAGTPAVRLFAERANAILPSFALNASTTPVVVEICRRLDGLPLAIELAAARANALPLPALRDRLDRRLAVLTSGFRDGPKRHRTMRDAIDWSHGLLGTREQVVFRRLAVFAGGFTIEAAECVDGPEAPDARDPEAFDSVVDAIGSLVDKSLVRRVELPDQEHRYHMLETIRAYALEHLEASGEEADVRNRHAAWCYGFIERFPGGWDYTPYDLWWLHPLEAERDNVRAALGWLERSGDASGMLRLAVAIRSMWEVRGSYSEAVEWFERGLAIGDASPPAIRLRAHATVGRKLRRQGRFAAARDHYQSALTLAHELGDDLATAQATFALGSIATNQEHYDQALTLLEEALERYLRLDDETGICEVQYFLGIVRLGQNEYAAAAIHLEFALDARRTGRPHFSLNALLNALGLVRCELGDDAGAARALAECKAGWDKGEGANQDILAEWLVATARLALTRNNPDQATRLLGAGEALADALGVPLLVPPPSQYQRLVSLLQCKLGTDRFSVTREAGRSLPAEEAAAEALVLDEARPGTSPATLSAREVDVLRLLATGLRDREIAESLFISVRTVEGHVARLLAKLGASSRLAAVRAASDLGITDRDR